jgi:hypothetical protein
MTPSVFAAAGRDRQLQQPGNATFLSLDGTKVAYGAAGGVHDTRENGREATSH